MNDYINAIHISIHNVFVSLREIIENLDKLSNSNDTDSNSDSDIIL